MDDFGVLVQGYGIKSQGKSAPMAASKTTPPKKPNNTVNLDPKTIPFSNSTPNLNSGSGSFFNDEKDDIFGFNSSNKYKSSDLFDDLLNSRSGSVFNDQNDDVFGFNSSNKANNYASSDVFDDVFQIPTKKSVSGSSTGGGLGFDVESMLKGSMNLNSSSKPNSKPLNAVDDDLIWGFSGQASSNVVVGTGDLLSSDPVDDFLVKLGKSGSVRSESNGLGSDDLIPGFGKSDPTNERAQAASAENSSSSSIEELEDFVTGGTKKVATGHVNGASVKKEKKNTVSKKSQEANFIDIDGSLNGDSVHYNTDEKGSGQMFPEEPFDLNSFFPAYAKKSVPETEDKSMNRNTNEVPDMFPEIVSKVEKKFSFGDFLDDFSPIIEAPTYGVFEKVEGESDERHNLRLKRHNDAIARMKNAVDQLNQREYQAQQEREERHRIGEVMESDMKRWAAGKEGNLRALLSSLEQVLAPELGWRPVTLTDLITSSQVKIAYKRAALCVHPDKVQQKGASLQQKYVAEKAFDLLKEAWNKFNTEELR